MRFVPLMVIKGRIRDVVSGAPCPRIRVRISGRLIDQVQNRYTRGNGRFKLIIPMTTENKFRIHCVGKPPTAPGDVTIDIILHVRPSRNVYDLKTILM